MTQKVGWTIAATAAIALNGCSEADVQGGAATLTHLINTGSFTPEQRGIRLSQSEIKPPATARPYAIDGTLNPQELTLLAHLDYSPRTQRYSDMVGSIGRPAYTTPSADYYTAPNGSWVEISYDAEGYASGTQIGSYHGNRSGQVAAIAPKSAPAPPPLPEPALVRRPIADHDDTQPRIVPVPTLPPSNDDEEAISYRPTFRYEAVSARGNVVVRRKVRISNQER